MRGAGRTRSGSGSTPSVLLALCVAALVATACGREAADDAAAPAPRASTPQVRLDRPSRSGPEDLAGPIPAFPGARPAGAPAWLEGEGESYEAEAQPEAVVAFYREALLAGGWALEGVTRVEGRHVLAAATSSRRSPMALRRATITAEATPQGSRFVVIEWHAGPEAPGGG